jgi:hypothetical protein
MLAFKYSWMSTDNRYYQYPYAPREQAPQLLYQPGTGGTGMGSMGSTGTGSTGTGRADRGESKPAGPSGV